MGIYLNKDNTQMYNSATYSEIYIDKSLLLNVTNSCLFEDKKYMCISRPRRFGKSKRICRIYRLYRR